MRRAPSFALAWALLSACSGSTPGTGSPPPAPDGGLGGPPPDATPPLTKAHPPGGVYAAAQYVRLVSDELATVHFSLEGAPPAEGAPNTTSGDNPVFWIRVGPGTTTLSFFAVDTAGNREAVRSETYVVGLAPSVTIDPPGAAVGLLATAALTWASDQDGTYLVELGGSGQPGSGRALASGRVRASTQGSFGVSGLQLAGTQRVWVHVTNADGHTGSSSALLELEAAQPVGPASDFNRIAVLPGGEKAYAVGGAMNGAALVSIDADPASLQYGAVIATIPYGLSWAAQGVAVSPDGTRVYVTDGYWNGTYGSYLYTVATDKDARVATATLGLTAPPPPGDVAVTTDGKRAYVLTSSSGILVVDLDPASPTRNQVVDHVWFNALGDIRMTPDGKRAAVSWQSGSFHGLVLVDVDPASPTHDTVLSGWPLPSARASGSGLAVSPDGRFAYVGEASSRCGVCKVDLVTNQVVAQDSTFVPAAAQRLALAAHGQRLLVPYGDAMLVYDAADMALLGSAQVGLPGHQTIDIALTPDGTRAYIIGASGSVRQPALIDLY